MIEVDRITKYYGSNAAINNVSFQVEKGEIVGFLGPNGAGKTTTMKILTCFFPPSSGTAKVAGFDIFNDSLAVRKRIGYLPENVPLYRDQTVWSQLNFVADTRGFRGSERKAKVTKAIDDCGLGDAANRIIENLSKGYRQRVGIAQALLHRPDVLILDEPTIGLDPKQISDIRQLIGSLAGDRTVIISTHILPEVSMVCNRALIINKGRIVADDSPENLTAQLQKGHKIVLTVEGGDSGTVESRLAGLPGVVKAARLKEFDPQTRSFTVESDQESDVRALVAKAVVESGWGLLELRSMDMSLEDIFLQLVTEESRAA